MAVQPCIDWISNKKKNFFKERRSKNNLKQKEYVNGLSLKVTDILVMLLLQRSQHIFYLLEEKNEMYHRKTLSSLMRSRWRDITIKGKVEVSDR